ncbi:MAG: VIT domain-containing protein [Pirellulaceae bacterium]|nr:VIT domain-containing protein [Pirellulaceae bacterium]
MNEVLLPRIDGEIESSDTFGIGALKTRQGNLPMCGLGYQTLIRGLAVRTEITQTFYNPFEHPIEATYVFPIEGTMAVVDCLMMVGDRIIRADLQERAAARQRYQEAMRRGHRAALLEENRSETFLLSVGNIPPGEAIRIRMITVGQLPVVNSVWTLRLPMVVAPRYTSGFEIPGRATGTGTAMDTDEVPDASHVTPPVLLPGFKNPVDLSVCVEIDLEALKPEIEWSEHLSSSLHTVVVNSSENRCRVQIRPGNRVDRDFILRGSVASQRLTTSARLEPPVRNERGTFAIDLVPPQIVRSEKHGRDVVFVLDRSGSMNGWKYVAAQRGVARLIDSLNEQDRFGVIAFDDKQLFFVDPSRKRTPTSYRELTLGGASLVAATDKNRFAAIKWLNNVKVDGGTEMAPAIELALDMVALDGASEFKASIILITDGQITGEDYVLSRLSGVAAQRRPRIYTLGVDRAVNASVLRRLSTATGGTLELVESESQMDKSIQALATEIGAPVLTDIRIASDEEHELVVGSADLYANRPVSIFGRTKRSELTVRMLAVDADGKPWEQDVLIHSDKHSGSGTLISLWGKGRVRMLEDQYAIASRDDEAARQKIVDTSIESRVLSRFTAYVAVDETEVVNKNGSVDRVVQPVELPEGWQLGRLPSIPAELRIRHARFLSFDSIPCSARNWQAAHVEEVGRKLVQEGKISSDQWNDSQQQSVATGRNAVEQAVSAGYISDSAVARTAANVARTPFIDLDQALVPENIVEQVPETVARENLILPVGEDGSNLVLATCNPWDIDTIEKLRFILNRNVSIVTCAKEPLQNAINELYGQIDGASADSILQEFTDAAIDSDDSIICLGRHPETVGSIDNFSSGYESISLSDFASGPPRVPYSKLPPLSRTVKSRAQTPNKDVARFIDSAMQRLIQVIFQEAEQLQAAKVIFRKTGDSVVIQFLIDGILHDRDRLPLRQWRLILEFLQALATKRSERDGIWEGEFSRESSNAIGGVATSDTSTATNQKISIRIEADETLEILFTHQN